MINILLQAGFTQISFTPWMGQTELGLYRFTCEGFEGSIEIHDNKSGMIWAHRTAKSGPGTGIRPVGGSSLKQLVKHIKEA